MFYDELIATAIAATLTLSSPSFADTIDIRSFVALFLTITFIIHGVAFTILALRRRKTYYFFLTGTFVFLTAVFFIRFENWTFRIPGIGLPLIVLLRIGAALCTTVYLRFIYEEEGSWLWNLRHWSKSN